MRSLFTLWLMVLTGSTALAAGPGYHLLKTIPLPGNGGWDYVSVDGAARRVYVSHGRGNNATVIEAKDGTVAGTVELGGKPEFAVADGTGSVFVNLEDKSVVVKIDARKLAALERWPVAPGEAAVSMAMDAKNRRL